MTYHIKCPVPRSLVPCMKSKIQSETNHTSYAEGEKEGRRRGREGEGRGRWREGEGGRGLLFS